MSSTHQEASGLANNIPFSILRNCPGQNRAGIQDQTSTTIGSVRVRILDDRQGIEMLPDDSHDGASLYKNIYTAV